MFSTHQVLNTLLGAVPTLSPFPVEITNPHRSLTSVPNMSPSENLEVGGKLPTLKG
jgi:hypothetical protein